MERKGNPAKTDPAMKTDLPSMCAIIGIPVPTARRFPK